MAAFKPFLLMSVCTAVPLAQHTCVSCEGGDQTALLQSHLSRKSELSTSDHHALTFPKISQLKDPSTRKTALIELQQTANHFANMDRSGVTDLVVELCRDAAEMLNTTLYSTVLGEHNFDQTELYRIHDGFDTYTDNVTGLQMENTITAAQDNVTTARNLLTECRTNQSLSCLEEMNCTDWIEDNCVCPVADHPYAASGVFCLVDEKDKKIEDRYCVGQDSDDQSHHDDGWRNDTATAFNDYSDALDNALALQATCLRVGQNCVNTTIETVTKTTECNALEQEFQVKSCDFRRIFLDDLATYDANYDLTLTNYENLASQVELREADRKVEWEVLERVICLLTSLTHNKTDDEGNVIHGLLNQTDSQAEIQSCWDMTVDVDHLDIIYEDPPDKLGLPDLGPKPCTAEFSQNETLGQPEACDIAHQEETSHQLSYHCFCNIDGNNVSDYQHVSNFRMVEVLGNAEITIENSAWALFGSGTEAVCTGVLSAVKTGSFNEIASLIPDEDGDNSTIDKFAFAYPSSADFCQDTTTGLTLKQWFCCKGGFVFQDQSDDVVSAYELLPYYSYRPTYGHDNSSFDVLDVEFQGHDEAISVSCNDIGCTLQELPAFKYGLGNDANKFCWTTTVSTTVACADGCIAWETTPDSCFISRLTDGIYDESIVQ